MNSPNSSQRKSELSFFVQAMVQNYLGHQYNSSNVFIYPELINCIDVFKREVEHVASPHILLEQLGNDYVSTYDIKYGDVEYLTKTQHLIQLITKIQYPIDTKLILLFVPSNGSADLKNVIEAFNKLRQQILSLDEQKRYMVFNALCNERERNCSNIINTLTTILINLENNELKHDFGEKNLTVDDAKSIEENFKKVEIKTLTLNELEKYPMAPAFQHEYVCKLIL